MEARAFVSWGLSDIMASISSTVSKHLPPGLKAVFSAASLLEPDPKTRAETNAIGVEHGWLGADEVRSEEGRSPRTDLEPMDLSPIKIMQQMAAAKDGGNEVPDAED